MGSREVPWVTPDNPPHCFTAPFRDNVKFFLGTFSARDPGPPHEPGLQGYSITLRTPPAGGKHSAELTPDRVVELRVLVETPLNSGRIHCDQCKCIGWSHHPVTSQKYHFIVHAAPPQTKGLDSTGAPMPRGCKQCTYCGRPVQNACKRCPLCQGDLTRLPSQVELHTHAMHGVVHANGFGHLLRVNGREGQGRRITGGELVGLWERICYTLRVREVSVEDVSKKRGMDFRLLHSVAYGCTWYGRWGYFFGRGSFGNTLATWRDAVQTLQSLTLDQLRCELASTSPKEAALIGEYVNMAAALRRPTRGSGGGAKSGGGGSVNGGGGGGVTLRTLSDLLAFMLQLPTPDLPVRDCAPGACSLLPVTVPPALSSIVASLPSFTLLKSVVPTSRRAVTRASLRDQLSPLLQLSSPAATAAAAMPARQHGVSWYAASNTSSSKLKAAAAVSGDKRDRDGQATSTSRVVGGAGSSVNGGGGKSTAAARWSTKRVRLAMEACVAVLRASPKPWLTRQDVRDAARLKIGDTGLLDFVLKTLSDKVVDGHLVHREYNNDTKVLEYRVERLAEDDPRIAAATTDQANGVLLRSPPQQQSPPPSPRHQPKPHTPKSSRAEVSRLGPLGVHVPKLARTSSKTTPRGSRGSTPRTPGGGWTQVAKTLGTLLTDDDHKFEPLLRQTPVRLELLQEEEPEEGENGEVPLTKKQVMDDLTAVFNAVMSHYRHPDDDDDDAGDDDDKLAPTPLSAQALQVTKAKRILMDTKQFVKHYDGLQSPPPNIPTYLAPAGGWPGVPGFVAWTDHRGGGGGRRSAPDPQPSCPTDADGGGGGGEEGGRRCAPTRKAAPPPATVRVLCGLALDVRPEQSLPPGPQVASSHAASKKRKVSHGDPPLEALVLRSGATVGELKAAASAAFGEVYHCLRNFQAEAVVAGLPPKSKDSMQLYPDSIPADVTVVLSGTGAELQSDWRFEGGVEQWVVGCACGTKDDDGERMVACDLCHEWHHTRCNGISDCSAVPNTFMCRRCQLHRQVNGGSHSRSYAKNSKSSRATSSYSTRSPKVDKAAAEKARLEKEKAARAAQAERTARAEQVAEQPINFFQLCDAEVPEHRERSTSGLIYADDLESQTDAGALKGMGRQQPAWSSFLC